MDILELLWGAFDTVVVLQVNLSVRSWQRQRSLILVDCHMQKRTFAVFVEPQRKEGGEVKNRESSRKAGREPMHFFRQPGANLHSGG
jgi:hypothetical protein